MKRLIYIIAASSMGVVTMAQTSTFYVKGGLNLANISTKDNGAVNDANILTSFHVGVMADLPVGKFFAIQPGLLFTGKGAKVQSGNEGDANYYKATTNPLYIELPVNAVFKIPLQAETNNNIFIGAGPYVAMGVAGKRKIEGNVLGVHYENKSSIDWSNDDPTTIGKEEGSGFGILRRFDAGFNATAGFQLNKVLLSVNYGHGLTKLQSGSNSGADNNNKHRVWGVSVGFGL